MVLSAVPLLCTVAWLQENPLAEKRVRLREEVRAADPFDHGGNEGDDCAGGSELGWLEGGADGGGTGQGDY